MRIVPLVPVPAKPLPVPPRAGMGSPTAIICAGLMLALAFLAFQITGALRTSSFSDCSSIGDSVKENCPPN